MNVTPDMFIMGVSLICYGAIKKKFEDTKSSNQKPQMEEQITQWPIEKDGRTDNTMANRKGQKDR